MHSSRMRTGRTLTIFRCLVPGGLYPQRKQKSKKKIPPQKKLWGGIPLNPLNHPPTPPRKIGDPPKKLETPGTRPPQTDLQGMLGYPPPQDWPARHAGIPTPLWTEWMTDRCKNITLAKTSFRPVNISAIYPTNIV